MILGLEAPLKNAHTHTHARARARVLRWFDYTFRFEIFL